MARRPVATEATTAMKTAAPKIVNMDRRQMDKEVAKKRREKGRAGGFSLGQGLQRSQWGQRGKKGGRKTMKRMKVRG